MVVVGAMDVVVVDVVVVAVVVVVVGGVVVVVDEVVVESTIRSMCAVDSELADDWSEHAEVSRSPTRRTIDFQRTPSR